MFFFNKVADVVHKRRRNCFLNDATVGSVKEPTGSLLDIPTKHCPCVLGHYAVIVLRCFCLVTRSVNEFVSGHLDILMKALFFCQTNELYGYDVSSFSYDIFCKMHLSSGRNKLSGMNEVRVWRRDLFRGTPTENFSPRTFPINIDLKFTNITHLMVQEITFTSIIPHTTCSAIFCHVLVFLINVCGILLLCLSILQLCLSF